MTNEFYNKVNAVELSDAERNDAIEEALWCAKLKKLLTPGIRSFATQPITTNISKDSVDPLRRGIVTKEWLPEYKAYQSARYRCRNENSPDYKNYGQRGIEFRFTSFPEFLKELGKKPSPQHSINRIDNDGHYEKGNVEWATATEQRRNQRPRTQSVRAA